MVLKRLVVGCLAIVMSGCALVSDGYSTKIKKEELETDYSTVYAEILEFGGFGNKEYQSELNLKISDDVSDAIAQFDVLAQDAAKALPKGVKSALNITQKVKRNRGGIISFISEHYIYTGGAHGTTSWYPVTVDVESENPHELTLGELFNTDDYIKRLNAIINKMVEENPDTYSELWAKPEITPENENRFYLTDDALVIFFPPYELSYYAKGFIEFPIELSVLNPILNDAFKTSK